MISVFSFLSTAFLTYVLISLHTRDWVTPCGIFSLIWFLTAAIADIPQSKDPALQQPWILETYLAIYISGLAVFFVGYLFQKKTNQSAIQLKASKKYKAFINFFMALSLIAVALRLYLFGFSFSELTSSFGELDIKDERSQAIPFVHYFEILTPFLAICAIFEISTSNQLTRRRRNLLVLYIIYSAFFYCLILSASRGSLLIIICGALYLFTRLGKIKASQLILYAAGVISLLSFLSFIRMSEETLTNSFLGDEGLKLFLSPLYTYIAFNFDNLNKLIAADHSPSYVFYSLKFFLWPLLKSDYESGKILLTDYNTLFFNARTWIYGFYHDLGLFGCFLYPTIVAVILSVLHNHSNSNPKYILPLMALQKPVVFAFFGNYFFGELILIAPIALIIFLSLIYTKNIKKTLSSQKITS
jgi:oligosaccharide repeat unit polymerase